MHLETLSSSNVIFVIISLRETTFKVSIKTHRHTLSRDYNEIYRLFHRAVNKTGRHTHKDSNRRQEERQCNFADVLMITDAPGFGIMEAEWSWQDYLGSGLSCLV